MPANTSEDVVQKLTRAKRVAVVGLSDDPGKASYMIAKYLISVGKEVFPVNPNVLEVLGRRSYARLDHVPAPVELVCVFRRAEYCGDVAREAVEAGVKAIWLQSGIVSEEARKVAEEAGIPYVEDRCLMVEHGHYAGGA